MGQNQFAGNVLQILLSWLQSLISSVWSLFSGGGGGSLLRWFSQNWLSMLVVLMIIGVSANILVYLLRWRPFWWWFRKKRLIVDDEMFDDEPLPPQKPAPRRAPERNEKRPRPVQPSTIVPRRAPAKSGKKDDLFMTQTLFDVPLSPERRAGASDKLYAKPLEKRKPAPKRAPDGK